MGKSVVLLAFLFFLGDISFCQDSKIDSLHKALKVTSGEKQIEVLHALVLQLWINYPDSAEKYVRQAIKLSDRSGGLRLKATSCRLLGGVHNYHGIYDSSLFYARKAYELSVKIKDTTLIASTLNNIGWSYYQLGSYSEALESLLRALSFVKSLKANSRFFVTTNIGYVYAKLSDYETARKYFNQAWASSGDNTNVKVDVLYGTGLTYLLERNFPEAKKYFAQSLMLAHKVNNRSWCARAYTGLARVFYQTRLMDSARIDFRKALQLYNEIKDRNGVSEVYYHRSKMFASVPNLDSAFRYIRISHNIAIQIKSRDRLLDNLRLFSDLYRQRKQYDSALYFQTSYVQLNDKKLDENSAQNISGIQVRIKEAANQKWLLIKDAQIAWRTQLNYYLVGVALLALITTLLAYSYYKAQKRIATQLIINNQKVNLHKSEIERKNKQLRNLNNEKNNLIGIVAHDLKSPLNQIKGLINIIKLSPDSWHGETANYIQMIEDSTGRLSGMITKILDVEAIESKKLNLIMEPLNLSEVIPSIVKRFEMEARLKQIQLHCTVAHDARIMADKSYLGEAIENLVSNAIKFSLPGKNIYVTLTTENHFAQCEVRDEGPGLSEHDKKNLFKKYQRLSATPTGNESSSGLGLSIVKKFVEAMKGEIRCESDEGKGASFFVKFNTIHS